jgi:hypothetical protein
MGERGVGEADLAAGERGRRYRTRPTADPNGLFVLTMAGSGMAKP